MMNHLLPSLVPSRIHFVILACAAIYAAPGSVLGQEWPTKPIRMVVISTPGGILDKVSRVISNRMAADFGKPVVVDNRPGAGSIIGTEIVSRANPDGYTIAAISTAHAINPAVYSKLPYDTMRGFTFIGQTVNLTNVLVVHPSVPAGTIAELVSYAKANPGKLAYGSGGTGQSNHLSVAYLGALANIDITHIPYKGSNVALGDVISGTLPMMLLDVLSARPLVDAGKLRALGVTGTKRSAAFPNVPTIGETVKGFNGNSWLGMLAPPNTPNTPKDVVAKLSSATSKILNSPEIAEQFRAQGVEVVGSSPEEFAAFIASEIPKWKAAADAAGIVPGQQ